MVTAVCLVVALALSLRQTYGAEPSFNYAEALQKTLYFLESQQNGTLSPFPSHSSTLKRDILWMPS